MIKWQYKVVKLTGYAYEKLRQLNELGADGWELVSRQEDECTFKRPYTDEQ